MEGMTLVHALHDFFHIHKLFLNRSKSDHIFMLSLPIRTTNTLNGNNLIVHSYK
jgi:hypothetical protein